MSHLGDFGAAARELDQYAEKDTFGFFGETFTVHGVIPPMLMLQLGAAATGKIEEQEGLAAIWEAMHWSLTKPQGEDRGQVVPEDATQFDRFYKLAVARRCNLESLIELAMKLFEVQAGRPTEEPQGSSPGPSTTSPSTNTSSSPRLVSMHPALAGMRPVREVLAG